ncbi:MAG TPA: nucleobase:cation symporter-2 family protein [Xanthobacteraceae bacterium]|nr:nucleobase:cation symporter-2 family protein [Xanthobacteraceae bacterium]
MTAASAHPVDERLPVAQLVPLGFQHVLVMYAGAVAVPLILGRALNLPPDKIAVLVNADLFACGIATLVQSIGIGPFGIRLPVMMGVTFASVSPMLAMANNPDLGLGVIYGSVIAAGIFGMIVAPVMSSLLRFFPPVVTGTIIAVIGISLMRIGVNWAAGANAPNLPGYGDPIHLAIAALVLIAILAITKFGRGFVANIAVLIGSALGFVVAWIIGKVDFANLYKAAWVDIIYPFQFGAPKFDLFSIVSMCLVMLVVMVESTGMFLAVGEMTGRKVEQRDLTRGLLTDGLGTLIGGVFNTFPYTSFSQNVGLVGVTGIRSRWVTVAGGVILLVFGLIPKLGALMTAVPLFVLGGAGIVMFGMVAATGVRILTSVDFATNRNNLFIVAISVGIGMIPLVAPTFFAQFPKALEPILGSGIVLASIAAVLLNAYFNGTGRGEAAALAAADAARAADHA